MPRNQGFCKVFEQCCSSPPTGGNEGTDASDQEDQTDHSQEELTCDGQPLGVRLSEYFFQAHAKASKQSEQTHQGRHVHGVLADGFLDRDRPKCGNQQAEAGRNEDGKALLASFRIGVGDDVCDDSPDDQYDSGNDGGTDCGGHLGG